MKISKKQVIDLVRSAYFDGVMDGRVLDDARFVEGSADPVRKFRWDEMWLESGSLAELRDALRKD